MSPRTIQTVILLSLVQVFIKTLHKEDKAEVQSELELAEYVPMEDTSFKQVPEEPNLWALTTSTGEHERCILAHWEPNQVGTSFVVCTHVFQKGSGSIPRSQLDRALELYRLHKSMGGI